MLETENILIVLSCFLIVWYFIKSSKHPKHFPPGPRLPLPILGDSYLLGKDLTSGFLSLTKKYGKMTGLWLGPRRAVVISDFEILQDILNKKEANDRQFRIAIRKSIVHLMKISILHQAI